MEKGDLKNMGKETVNHPQHYNRENAIECIDEMILIFGEEVVKNFCLCNAWKYRYRAADKNGAEDLKKSDWYIRKYKELCDEGKSTITVSGGSDVITIPYINNNVKTTPAIVPSSFCIDYNKPTTSTSCTTTGVVMNN